MTFTLRLGVRERPLPQFQTAVGCRWEFECGWCQEKFMTAGELVAHVRQERERCGNSAT